MTSQNPNKRRNQRFESINNTSTTTTIQIMVNEGTKC